MTVHLSTNQSTPTTKADLITLPFSTYYELTSCVFTSIMLGYYIHILFEILTEYFEYPRHYDRAKSLLLTILSHFNFKLRVWALIAFSIAWMIMLNEKLIHPFSLIIIFITWFILRIDMTESTHTYKKFLRQDTGLDYGCGMASNYFHGFLNIVLPENNEGIGFIERILDFQDAQRVVVAVPKLFILLPHSLHSPKEFKDDWIEKSSSVETVYSHRAGVPGRPYTVGVYRFKNKLKRTAFDVPSDYYVVAECATPLLSYYESINNLKITSTAYMEDLKLEVVKKFAKSLKKFIESTPGTKGLVEVLYFDDGEQKVGEVLECAVKELWKKGLYPLT
ncbi:TMEM173 family protein [Megaselia abdita]